jgi:hypothetical protein
MDPIKIENGADDRGERQRKFDALMVARNARKAAAASAAADYEIDVMTALDAAEQEYGDDRVKRVDISPGVCSVIIARTDALTAPVRHLRTLQRSANAKAPERLKVAENIARAAVVWPAKGAPMDLAAVDKAYPAAVETIVNAALVLAGAQAEEDAGK